jgi:hypothetical protein
LRRPSSCTILARGAPDVRQRLGGYLLPLVGLGCCAAVTAALIGLYGGGFFKGVWTKFYFVGLEIKLGTPQLFDLGVMLVVVGMTITYLLNLSEARRRAGGGRTMTAIDAGACWWACSSPAARCCSCSAGRSSSCWGWR